MTQSTANKKMYFFCFLLITFFGGRSLFAQINYSMTASTPGYTALAGGGTNIPDLAAGSDLTISAPIPIGFNFVFDAATYTVIQASDNGYIHFGSDLAPTGYGNGTGDVVIPNDFTDATAITPGNNTMRPFIAPLWEELAVANIGGNASYTVTGAAPNRILTVEWNKMSWRAPTGSDQISFQVKLHETTNIIDFIYFQGPQPVGLLPTASIGLAGKTPGDYYSLSDSGPTPVASKSVNTTSIATKPATGQMYRWSPAVTNTVTGISKNTNPEAISSIYFDHNSNRLMVSANFQEAGNFNIEITDVTGRSVYFCKGLASVKGENNFQFLMPACSTGIYIAKISMGNSQYQSKFVKE
jgi:hypothetical protein